VSFEGAVEDWGEQGVELDGGFGLQTLYPSRLHMQGV
jgi:hypothetical protein